jgi:hypothetical protein
MRERSECSRLALEACTPARLELDALVQQLDRDASSEVGILGEKTMPMPP